ncbi:MAG: histidine kinase dimerization/phospho-acceptor domain-containing protein, partial [Myxococcales bacterium]
LSEGMAHDARNPLNAIALNVEVLGEKLKSGGPELRAAVDKYLKAIKEQVSRADRIIREYVGFVRPEHGRSAETDLAELVHRAVEVCRHDARKRGVRVDARLTNVAVTANSSDLSQAILQLVMHGIDASSGGTLQIAVERHGQEAVLQLHEELAAAPAANGASPATRRIPMSALEHLLGKLRANLLSRPLERGGELVVRFPAA